ncbi:MULTISPECIES: threonine aldolase family protein [Mumia]|uniref:Threonine aldolase family protein n=1 Tax=Mumia xiangluensis TaxID=1678900 RepID=A0ABW1QMT9_9ACTN|nr:MULTISPECIES: beta-eliminating lyase-related protein [Mumia]
MAAFASDNYAPAHPAILDAVAAANTGHAVSYGDDRWTAHLGEVVRHHFGDQAQAYPVFNGTGANVVSLGALLPRWGSAIVSDVAHLNTDENAAPERVAGIKLLPVDAPDGKLTTAALDRYAANLGDPHRAQALAVSLTQSTELGTVYSLDEIRQIADAAHAYGMRVHIDGSRIANAAAYLGVGLGALTTELGIDAVSFGGTKNGILLGEAVVVLSPDAVTGLEFMRKTSMQLASKMRYVSAQLAALLDPEHDLWLHNATASNARAAQLRSGVDALAAELAADGRVHDSGAPLLHVERPTQANVVFPTLPRSVADAVRAEHRFYDWRPGVHPDLVESRWMCSWDTTADDVEAFLSSLRKAFG